MGAIPIFTTERLILRPFRDDDAPAVQRMLITPHVAETTLNVPYPYPPGAALEWIRRERKRAAEGLPLHWAITRPPDQVIGAIGIALRQEPAGGELGYWVGADYWNQGYATEAVRAVVAYGFDHLELGRIEAMCFTGNIASARVLEKAGLIFEELREAHLQKNGEPRDVLLYGVTRSAYRSRVTLHPR